MMGLKGLIIVLPSIIIALAVLILLGIYLYKEVVRQTSSIKTMLIGIAIILLGIIITTPVIRQIVGILGVIVVIYGSKKLES